MNDNTKIKAGQVEPTVGEDCPPLPAIPDEDPRLIVDLAAQASPWLDRYEALSRKWAPRAYDDFHEACGLFCLSTLAARRVHIQFGPQGTYPSLYQLLTSRTSLWTKSTAATIGTGLLKAAGLWPLLAPDNSTPQAFLSHLVATLPASYPDLDDEHMQALKLRLAFAGQRGWFYEEFGQHLSAMMQRDSIMRAFHGILRRFDDHQDQDTSDTIVRGVERIEKPYLTLLGNMTPSDLKPFARRGSALWSDGYFARFAFIVAPLTGYRDDPYPRGKLAYPIELIKPLRDWHERLGVPEVTIDAKRDKKSQLTGLYTLQREPLPEQTFKLSDGAWRAYYAYDAALRRLMSAHDRQDLDGSYARLPMKALRIAGLLASLAEAQSIQLKHFYRGRAIAERWRASLHRLVQQLAEDLPGDTRQELIEAQIERALRRDGPLSIREMRRKIRATYPEIQKTIEGMHKAHAVHVDKPTSDRTIRYRWVVGS